MLHLCICQWEKVQHARLAVALLRGALLSERFEFLHELACIRAQVIASHGVGVLS